MFKTYEDGRAQLPLTSSNSGMFAWEYMVCDSLAPWLLVTTRITESNGENWTQYFMLTNIQQLQHLMEKCNVFLYRVQLVRLNIQRIPGWEIDDVLRIRASITEDDTNSVEYADHLIEYHFLGGEKFVYVHGKKSNVVGKELQQIYSILTD